MVSICESPWQSCSCRLQRSTQARINQRLAPWIARPRAHLSTNNSIQLTVVNSAWPSLPEAVHG